MVAKFFSKLLKATGINATVRNLIVDYNYKGNYFYGTIQIPSAENNTDDELISTIRQGLKKENKELYAITEIMESCTMEELDEFAKRLDDTGRFSCRILYYNNEKARN